MVRLFENPTVVYYHCMDDLKKALADRYKYNAEAIKALGLKVKE